MISVAALLTYSFGSHSMALKALRPVYESALVFHPLNGDRPKFMANKSSCVHKPEDPSKEH